MKVNERKQADTVCPQCGQHGAVTRFERRESEEVRGLAVEVVKALRRCSACGAEFENSRDPDWRVDAYDQFRKAKGWVTPEQIVEWRRRHELSQEDVGRLLGWGEVTLGRYERGALQTESHNVQLTQLMAEGGIARALAERPDALPDSKKAAVRARLEADYGIPTADEIRRFRAARGKTPGEAGLDVFVSANTWLAWEAGTAFPDARAGRLIHLLMADNTAPDQMRVSVSDRADANTVGTGGHGGKKPGRSPEAVAFWSETAKLGFLRKKLEPLFPSWAKDAELHRTASIELGAFAQVHLGLATDFFGKAELVTCAPVQFKATRHKGNPAHAAAVAISLATARLVAHAARPAWRAPLPSAAEVRAEVLRSTNRGWVDFANLAACLWTRGIPVIHLPKLPVRVKGMDALVTRVEGRPVIVLNKDQPLSDWMLFVLAHEGGHIGKGHLPQEEGAAVVDDDIAEVFSSAESLTDDEAEANKYAEEVLVDQGDHLAIEDRIPIAERFASVAIEFGRRHRISPGHVVLNAIRHTSIAPFNLMPLAVKTLKIIDRRLGTPTTDNTCRSLAEANLDLAQLRPDSAEYLRKLGVV